MYPRNYFVVFLPQVFLFFFATFKDVKNINHLPFFGDHIRTIGKGIHNYAIVEVIINRQIIKASITG
jgi:hypothetical protein